MPEKATKAPVVHSFLGTRQDSLGVHYPVSVIASGAESGARQSLRRVAMYVQEIATVAGLLRNDE